MHNHAYWREVFLGKFTRELGNVRRYSGKARAAELDRIEEEARRQSEEAWDAFMAAPATGDEDLSEYAEVGGHAEWQLLPRRWSARPKHTEQPDKSCDSA
jgi:hypothetical protein